MSANLSDPNYQAGAIAGTLVISRADQTITFTPVPPKTYLDAAFSLTATTNSGLLVSFSVVGNCSLAGATVSITGAGSCNITASQAGDSNYNPASVTQIVAIAKAPATLSFGSLSFVYNGSPISAPVSVTPAGLVSTTVTYSGSPAPPTNAGSYPVTATLSNANYQAAPISGTLEISQADQSISFPPIASKIFGDAPSRRQPPPAPVCRYPSRHQGTVPPQATS